MDCDVYHSGEDNRPRAPFLLIRPGTTVLPQHPDGQRVKWTFWKTAAVRNIAAAPMLAQEEIRKFGYVIQ